MSSCIVVSDVPDDVTEDKLTIYFQKTRNGGGDVKKIEFLGGGEVRVEFEEKETVKSVLLKQHEINGRKIRVEEFKREKKIFSKVKATLSPAIIQKLGKKEMNEIAAGLGGIRLENKMEKMFLVTDSIQNLKEFEQKTKALLSSHRNKMSTKPTGYSNETNLVTSQLEGRTRSHDYSGNQLLASLNGGKWGLSSGPLGNSGARRKMAPGGGGFSSLATSSGPPMDTTPPASPKPITPKLPPQKLGPFPQPEGLVQTNELHSESLSGYEGYETIHMYFRFPGGKIDTGDGPVHFLSYNRTACLPATQKGRQLFGMLMSASAQGKLFVVARKNRKDFGIWTKVKLLTSEEYDNSPEYLEELFESLLRLSIQTPPTLPPLPPRVETHHEVPDEEEDEPTLQLKNRGPHPQPDNGVLKVERDDARAMNFGSLPSDVGQIKDEKKEEDLCAICLLPLSTDTTRTLTCNHTFHANCVRLALQRRNKCPMCNQPLGGASSQSPVATTVRPAHPLIRRRQNAPVRRSGILPRPTTSPPRAGRANQPLNGVMKHMVLFENLPGFPGCNTIAIRYEFPSGVQTNEHLNPGIPYPSTSRDAYLPDNREGRDLLELLKRAFNQRLTFTVGRSETSGLDNQIVWNGIPHKTNKTGGSQCFGYPDHNYLSELRRVLASLGIQ